MPAYDSAAAVPNSSSKSRVVDLRSDTVTKPTQEMREVMARAPVGDDVYGEDPSVNELERRAAQLLGKEAAMYVCSGTMGNLIAAIVYAQEPFAEIILGKYSHVARLEIGGIHLVAHASSYQITNNEDGTLPLDELETVITSPPNIHCTVPRVVFLENTYGYTGGKVLPHAYVKQVKAICEKRTANKVALHCDGARLWHAAVSQGISMAEVAAPLDTVQCCLSKALGAPIGSVLVGPADFIARARHVRKMIGGGMRQAGIVASAGLYAIDNHYNRLVEDHAHAKLLASLVREGLSEKKAQQLADIVEEDVNAHPLYVHEPESNMLLIDLPSTTIRDKLIENCAKQNVLFFGLRAHTIRIIPNIGNTTEDIERAGSVIVDVLSELIKA